MDAGALCQLMLLPMPACDLCLSNLPGLHVWMEVYVHGYLGEAKGCGAPI